MWQYGTLPRYHMNQAFLLLLLSLPKLGGDHLQLLCQSCFHPSPNSTILWATTGFYWLTSWQGVIIHLELRERMDLASTLELHAYLERAVITGDKRMNRWTLQHFFHCNELRLSYTREFSIPLHPQELQQHHHLLFPTGFPLSVFQLS